MIVVIDHHHILQEFNSKVDADHLRQIVRYKVENFITEISGFSFNFMAKVAGGNVRNMMYIITFEDTFWILSVSLRKGKSLVVFYF